MFKIMDGGCFCNNSIKNKISSEYHPCCKAQDHKRILECSVCSVTGLNQPGTDQFVLLSTIRCLFFLLRTMKRSKKIASSGKWAVGLTILAMTATGFSYLILPFY